MTGSGTAAGERMNNLHVKYLLVGGGLASSSAAEAIRAIDRDGSLMLVAQEVNRPYHRPPLSKEYLRRQKPRAELFANEPEWFEKNHVQLRSGRRVSHLDVPRVSAVLDSGEHGCSGATTPEPLLSANAR